MFGSLPRTVSPLEGWTVAGPAQRMFFAPLKAGRLEKRLVVRGLASAVATHSAFLIVPRQYPTEYNTVPAQTQQNTQRLVGLWYLIPAEERTRVSHRHAAAPEHNSHIVVLCDWSILPAAFIRSILPLKIPGISRAVLSPGQEFAGFRFSLEVKTEPRRN